MNSDQQTWRIWADLLHRWGWDERAADLLESASPLALVGAQLVFFSHPVLQLFFSDEQIEAFARILENPEQARQLSEFIRKVPNS